MQFNRRFTKEGVHPFDTVNWITVDAEIPGSQFKQEKVEFPDFYSQNAINIIASKYFCGKLNTEEREYSLKQLINRVVNTNVQWGQKQGYFTSDEDKTIYAEELTYMLLYQMYSFNSPVWFNIGNPWSRQQVSACFIISAEDTIESIGANAAVEMQVFRGGSGAGSNRSKLRSSREGVSGGGKASGPNSFMKIYDAVANVTKSGGKNRRAAKMEILNVDHGDIREFIWQKAEEEKKVQALIAAGWNNRFDDPKGAYGSVYFQNSNQSIRATNAFMEAVEKDQDWALLERYPTAVEFDPNYANAQGQFYRSKDDSWLLKKEGGYKVIEWLKAKNLFKEAAECAWLTGDPGIQFHDTINEWHTCPNSGTITASNPCSEYMFLDDTSCNLGSLNLMKFFSHKKVDNAWINSFDIDGLIHASRIATVAKDIWISEAAYPTEKIATETKKYRTIGLGFTNLGALLLSYGLPYDSHKARNLAAAISALIHNTSYATSGELGKELGAFEEWEKNAEAMANVLRKHYDATLVLQNRISILHPDDKYLSDITDKAIEQIKTVTERDASGNFIPMRNAQVTVLAPTGTISFMMDCETTGVEPVLGLVSYKKLVGGGELILTIPSIRYALETLGYEEKTIQSILTDIEKNKLVSDTAIAPEHRSIFATSFGTGENIPWQGHINMMAAIQPFLSGAISKTVNMPNSATIEDVMEAYKMAYHKDLKALAIYRDGCKSSQPLNTKSEKQTVEIVQDGLSNGRPKPIRKKLPNTRKSITHKFSIGGFKGFLTVGFYDDNKPGEIFVNMSKEGSTISGLMDSWATMFSIALQYGVPLEFMTQKFLNTKFEPSGITTNADIRFATSVIDYISKFLMFNYLDKQENPDSQDKVSEEQISIQPEIQEKHEEQKSIHTGEVCHICGGLMVKTGKCNTCLSCGETTGCG
jgi:ribonucleoside-diphosphate reductase alpha chain